MFLVRIHDDLSRASRFHQRKRLGKLFEIEPMSYQLRQVDLARFQYCSCLVPGSEEPTAEDAPDVSILEDNPVGYVKLDLLRGQPEQDGCSSGTENFEPLLKRWLRA